MTHLAQSLHIGKGITAIIGGGGKTTLMYCLAEELRESGSVIITTSTHIHRPEAYPVVESVNHIHGVVCVGTPCENGKLTTPVQSFSELSAIADYVLVEADGSAHHPLKAHRSFEPVIPEGTSQTILVVGLSGINRPVEEAVHCPELFRNLCHSDVTTPEAVATVIRKEHLHDRVLINQADTPELAALGEQFSRLLDAPTVITSLKSREHLC